MPAASSRFNAYSGDVRSQRVRGAPSVRPENSRWKGAMFGSVLPPRDSTGVSTSSTPRSAKNARIAALRRARSRSASTPAVGCHPVSISIPRLIAVFGKEGEKPRLVPDLDAELARLGQLAARGLAGNHEGGLLRHAAGDLRAQSLEPILGLVAGQRRQG